ncbi:hypothetical protein OCOJLMKI_3824 [Methylobacterium iners]|uniref:DNA primase/polymerase bifunctional N-terminal domain-containing protein n=2 Tax=Methylobacterium iners TaxID=418707 RepID=A0ABQ4S161_9HYPH|nr:hypothetical protein OCOJLMKI_3824 [Methylobacterium iners]
MNKIVALPDVGNKNLSLGQALAYAAHGWRVFPVNAGNKKPWDPETDRLMGAWQHRATTDPTQIEAWWKARPDLGVGVATGRETRVIVLDFDVTKGKDGLADKAKLEARYGKLPASLTQSTPSGGTQEFYAYPAEAEDIPNRVGFGYVIAGHRARPLCGIDVRGDGGQVNVPPTAREAGAYSWHSDPFTTPLAELPARWSEALNVKALPTREPAIFSNPDDIEWTDGQGSAASVMAGCAANDRLRTAPKGVTEWGWKMSAGVIGRCENGRAIFHKLSALDPERYDPAATDKALDYMLGKTGPHGCEAFAAEMPETCAGCLYRDTGKITTPSQLAHKDVEMNRFQRSHYYVTEAELFYDITKQITKSKSNFSDTYAHINIRYTEQTEKGPRVKIKRGTKANLFTGDTFSAKADLSIYEPGRLERIFTGPRGVTFGNMWLDDGIQAVPGDCSLWLNHLAYLMPNEENEREDFLDLMAFSVQQPGVKVRHAKLFISLIQQNGKSTLFEAWEKMLGKSNTVRVSNTELSSQFQGGIFNKQLAVLEEIFQRDRDIYNNMKDIITEPEKRVQLKNQDFVERRPPLIMIGFSNKSVPINGIEPGDQRWHVIEIIAPRRDNDYYLHLRAEGWKQIPAFKAWLLKRDLSHFDPAAPPRMTKAKQRLIADGRTPSDKALDAALEEHGRPVVVVELVRRAILGQGAKVFPSNEEVGDGLRQRGWVKRGQHRTGDPSVVRGTFYTLGDEFADASPQTLRDALHWHGVGRGKE